MKLRKLQEKDAPNMYEWMMDKEVVQHLKTDFFSKTIDDCLSFIVSSYDDPYNIHMAIVDENDEYMGTVSLKHIHNSTAEFGITIRKIAMGRGFSKFGMERMLDIGFNDLSLSLIYWCVDPANLRAIRFYEKKGYNKCKCPQETIGYTDSERETYIWYSTSRNNPDKN